jgi:hypothetical protein
MTMCSVHDFVIQTTKSTASCYESRSRRMYQCGRGYIPFAGYARGDAEPW